MTGLRLAEPSRALGILPSMPTAAGNRLRCEQCETEIIVVKGTDGEVSCCGQPMAAREG
jgi:Desulfoferrodoxin, N-terminal domain